MSWVIKLNIKTGCMKVACPLNEGCWWIGANKLWSTSTRWCRKKGHKFDPWPGAFLCGACMSSLAPGSVLALPACSGLLPQSKNSTLGRRIECQCKRLFVFTSWCDKMTTWPTLKPPFPPQQLDGLHRCDRKWVYLFELAKKFAPYLLEIRAPGHAELYAERTKTNILVR